MYISALSGNHDINLNVGTSLCHSALFGMNLEKLTRPTGLRSMFVPQIVLNWCLRAKAARIVHDCLTNDSMIVVTGISRSWFLWEVSIAKSVWTRRRAREMPKVIRNLLIDTSWRPCFGTCTCRHHRVVAWHAQVASCRWRPSRSAAGHLRRKATEADRVPGSSPECCSHFVHLKRTLQQVTEIVSYQWKFYN